MSRDPKIGGVAWKRIALALVAALLVGYAWGLASYKLDVFPMSLLRPIKEYVTEDQVNTSGFHETRGREIVNCSALAGPDTAVYLTLGQSNSANHGETLFRPTGDVYNFNLFDGRCYVARDPMLGATGAGGSVWSRLGDLLLAHGLHGKVVFAPIGVNASRIERWVPGGDLHWRIETAVTHLKSLGLAPTHILWHQGEADVMASTDGTRYGELLGQLISSLHTLASSIPIYVGITSMCHNAGSDAIRNAQRNAPRDYPNVFAGADSDSLDSLTLRYDGCHFSDRGLARHAELWLNALTAPP